MSKIQTFLQAATLVVQDEQASRLAGLQRAVEATAEIEQRRESKEKVEELLRQVAFECDTEIDEALEDLQQAPTNALVQLWFVRHKMQSTGLKPKSFSGFKDKDRVRRVQEKLERAIVSASQSPGVELDKATECFDAILAMPTVEEGVALQQNREKAVAIQKEVELLQAEIAGAAGIGHRLFENWFAAATVLASAGIGIAVASGSADESVIVGIVIGAGILAGALKAVTPKPDHVIAVEERIQELQAEMAGLTADRDDDDDVDEGDPDLDEDAESPRAKIQDSNSAPERDWIQERRKLCDRINGLFPGTYDSEGQLQTEFDDEDEDDLTDLEAEREIDELVLRMTRKS